MIGRGRRGRVGVALAVAFLTCVTGCGLPSDDGARSVDPREVPYGLLRAQPASTAPPVELKSAMQAGQAELFLLGPGDRLVPVPEAVGRTLPAAARLADLFTALERGPDENQRSQGLGTALTPGVRIELRDLTNGVALVQVDSAQKDPAADRLPLAIGQVVLTATSLSEVDTVQLVRDGTPVEVPLPGGALTSSPLSRQDYAPLLSR